MLGSYKHMYEVSCNTYLWNARDSTLSRSIVHISNLFFYSAHTYDIRVWNTHGQT